VVEGRVHRGAIHVRDRAVDEAGAGDHQRDRAAGPGRSRRDRTDLRRVARAHARTAVAAAAGNEAAGIEAAAAAAVGRIAGRTVAGVGRAGRAAAVACVRSGVDIAAALLVVVAAL